MILRPRQQILVDRVNDALLTRDNTLAVAPTGAGKTVCLSAIARDQLVAGAKTVLVLQHRDELVSQNRSTFVEVAGRKHHAGVVDASLKQFSAPVIFAMVQTLTKTHNVDRLPPIDLLQIDEAHHSIAKSYRTIINACRDKNPGLKLVGVTATPNRGDKKGLRGVFDNVADQIDMRELIATGVLVPPRTFVVDIGVQDDLKHVKRSVSDFDMSEVAKIMDHKILNEKIVESWKEKAGDRSTVVFCSTVEHANHVVEAFVAAGVLAGMVDGGMAKKDRDQVLRDFDGGKIQVVVNVAVLTEGWDCQHVGCVVLLRPSSYKSTMIQMIGRGLRRMDPERYPAWPPKSDCVVLDFGTSVLTHGTLDQHVLLDDIKKGAAPRRVCPECEAEVPITVSECPICGHVFVETSLAGGGGAAPDKNELSDFVLTEIDLFASSPYQWEELWGGIALVATAFDAWTAVVNVSGVWHAVAGATGDKGARSLMRGEKLICLSAADDYLRVHGDTDSASKSRSWLHMRPTDKQLQILQRKGYDADAHSRYRAAAYLTWMFNEKAIRMSVAA